MYNPLPLSFNDIDTDPFDDLWENTHPNGSTSWELEEEELKKETEED